MRKTLSTVGSIGLGLLAVVLGPQTCRGQQEIAVEISPEKVGRYEKVEFRIRLDTQCRNPFDSEEADLSVVLSTPDGRQFSLPAFYCQEYQRRRMARGRGQASWMYPSGEPVWKARFAPMHVGSYRAVVNLKDRRGTRRSRSVPFECIPSGGKGFVRVSKKDPRFFELSNGEPFFAVGQNLAFIGQGQYANLSKAEEIFDNLSRNGANYLRIWTCCKDWAMAIEARKSAWGRSWNWKPPIVPVPDGKGTDRDPKCVKLAGGDGSTLAVSPSHAVALRPKTRYVFSGRSGPKGMPGCGSRWAAAGSKRPLLPGPNNSGPNSSTNSRRHRTNSGWAGRPFAFKGRERPGSTIYRSGRPPADPSCSGRPTSTAAFGATTTRSTVSCRTRSWRRPGGAGSTSNCA